MLTLFHSALSCSDKGDLIRVHHVMCAVVQYKPHTRYLMARQRPLLTCLLESLQGTERKRKLGIKSEGRRKKRKTAQRLWEQRAEIRDKDLFRSFRNFKGITKGCLKY